MNRMMTGALLALAVLAAAPMAVAQGEPLPVADVMLEDPAAEERARDLFADIRCVVCQHEAISDSPAAIAADMRRLVREQISQGRTDAEIRSDLVRRYGDYVLFTPPFRAGTLLLWLGPLLLVLGAGLVIAYRARRTKAVVAPLDAEEEAALARLVENGPVNKQDM